MNVLERLQELLPLPYAVAPDAVLSRWLDVFALEIEILQEDLDRLRQCHWIRTAYRLQDAAKLGALLGIEPLPWEHLATFRERLLALVATRLQGALGPREIKFFVFDYLKNAERVMGCSFIPGLQTVTFEEAYHPPSERPHFRPLGLVENPEKRRYSNTLKARGGRVPYLCRWQESNKGLNETVPTFHLSGLWGDRTSVPVLVNLTTGEMLGFKGRLKLGETLTIQRAQEANSTHPRLAKASLNGRDVTQSLFSTSSFALGIPWEETELDEMPQLPRLARGANDWIFLAVGLFDVKGLNRFFFSLADAKLREGIYDETFFDQAIFPSGPITRVEMEWVETEPASFEVRVPRYLVTEPSYLARILWNRPSELVGQALAVSIQELHAAGVRAEVRFLPFQETQRQRVRVQLPWIVLEPERGPSGQRDRVEMGGVFGESTLGRGRFE